MEKIHKKVQRKVVYLRFSEKEENIRKKSLTNPKNLIK